MKKYFMILTILLIGFVFAGHNSSVPVVRHFSKAVVSINQNVEINKNNTFDLKNIQTDISNSNYSLKNQNRDTLHLNNATPDFTGFKQFFFGKNSTLTCNFDVSSNSVKIRHEINPRAP